MENRKPVTEVDMRRYKELNSKLQHDLQIAKHEKDSVEIKLDSLVAEIERLKVASQDTSRLNMKIEELKQENEALKISLESSERIRKQQKELISMLQRSQSIAETSIASVNSNLSHMGYNDDDNSTQLTQTSGIMSQMSNGRISASSSMQEENKSWLESSPQRRFTSGDSSVSSSAAEYVVEGIASTGRRGSGRNTRRTKKVNGSGHDNNGKTGVFKMTTKTAHAAGEIHNPRTDTRLFKSEYSQRNLSKQQMPRKGTKGLPPTGNKHTKSQFIRPQFIAPAPHRVSESKTRLVREFEALSPYGRREAIGSIKSSRSTSAVTSNRPPKYPTSTSRPSTAPTKRNEKPRSILAPFR